MSKLQHRRSFSWRGQLGSRRAPAAMLNHAFAFVFDRSTDPLPVLNSSRK